MKKYANVPNVYRYIKNLINGELVFDIGASTGTITKILSEMGAKVVAVEPQKRRTEGSKDFANAVEVLNACVSDKDGMVGFHVCDNMPNISTCFAEWKNGYHKKNSRWEKPRDIKSVTLDTLIDRYGTPSYIKIDVEGYEGAVLRGLSKKIPMISLEYTGGYPDNFMDCMDLLEKLGSNKFVGFEKEVIKATKTKKKTKICNRYEFDDIDDVKKYFTSLPKYQQGDLLVINE
jgi:FkbM family methyltransferase